MQVNINPEMVTLAREYRGLTQNELAQRMNITQSSLSRIEKGLAVADEEILKKFSDALNLQVDFFLRRGQTFMPNLYYRKRAKTSPKIVTVAEAEMNIHRLNIQELLKSIDIGAKPIPMMDTDQFGTPEHIAKMVRQLWGIPSGVIKNLFETIERQGVVIVMCDFESSEIDGRSMFTDAKQPIIFLNKNICVDRQRFTLCHELAHLIMHIGFSVPESRDTEKEANSFANEFLIPETELKKQIFGRLMLPQLADLKRYWRVSMAAILYKATKCNFISAANNRMLNIQLSTSGMKTQEPPELEPPKEKPVLLSSLIKLHLEDLEFSMMDLSKLFGFGFSELRSKYLEIDEVPKIRAILR